jgi:mono/diheme cytochrome c family protein
VPQVRHAVRVNQLDFPFDIRAGMAVWNVLYFRPGPWVPVAEKPPEWNRGSYLVDGLGHCGACHTPKTALGGDDVARPLAGGLVLGWNAPALDADPRTGLGRWSVDEIVAYLASGHTARAAAGGPMAEVVEDSTSRMSDADLRAIALYLKQRPASPVAGAAPPDSATMQVGAAIYADACAACHTATGAGVARLFPALTGSAAVQADDPASVLRVILHGARSAATDAAPTGAAMPGFGWKLSDAQAAGVATYVRNAWGNAAPAVSAVQARRARNTP